MGRQLLSSRISLEAPGIQDPRQPGILFAMRSLAVPKVDLRNLIDSAQSDPVKPYRHLIFLLWFTGYAYVM